VSGLFCARVQLPSSAPLVTLLVKKISMWLLLAFVEGGREFAVVVATSNGTVVTRRNA